MATFTAPLVGMHFRPPAKDIVNCLTGETEFLLEHQPENPHDGDAVRVLLYGFCPGGQHEDIFASIAAMERENGRTDEDWRLSDPQFLGFIANSEKTGGKFASKLVQCLALMETASIVGKLTFGNDGKPAVRIDIPDEVAKHLGEKAAVESLEKTAEKVARQSKHTDLDDEIPF